MHAVAKNQPNRPLNALCEVTDEADGTIKLIRDPSFGWGLSVVLPPTEADPTWRAGGFYFGAVDELANHCQVTLKWLLSVRPETLTAQKRGDDHER